MRLNEIHFFVIGFFIGSSIVLIPFYFFHEEQLAAKEEKMKRMIVVEPNKHDQYNETLSEILYSEVKILCMVMTQPRNHQTKAIHVRNTWGRRCNKLVFMSSEIDLQLDTVVLPIEESRAGLWNKTKAAFKYLHAHYLDDYDWFMKADDDK